MYTLFDPMSVKPEGWLKRQLTIQAEGLSGNLYKVWPDIRDSVRIGGTKNDWERVPYWLDGFIPLSYLLRDEEKMRVADKYVMAIVNNQREDGWICAGDKARDEFNDNTWEYLLVLKVLALYCDFTGSRKVEKALYKALRNLYDCMKSGEVHLISWGKFRWFEGLVAILHVYKRKKEAWLIELGRMIREQGADWTSFKDKWKVTMNDWHMDTHIVNIGMMFKAEALCCELFGEKYTGQAEDLWNYLTKYHGSATGAFFGDECLAGNAANRGYELCSVVELMYSCEILYRTTGKRIWAERLEKLAFNALPATISDDMWTHQYDQMTNQIACYRHPWKPFYGTNGCEANIFGLEPNFGCCTANFNQGWPKFAMNIFLKMRGGVEASLLPGILETRIGHSRVTIHSETDYPFKNAGRYTVTAEEPVTFTFRIRIPSWAKNVRINGKKFEKQGSFAIRKEFSGTETFNVEFETEPRFVRRPYGLSAVEKGALVFALPIKARFEKHEYEKDGVERKFPFCDYELFPESDWNYAFASSDLSVTEDDVPAVPFSSKKPAVCIAAEGVKVEWPMAEGYAFICDRAPSSTKPIGETEPLTLIPYGAAKLRMTEMPLIGGKKNG